MNVKAILLVGLLLSAHSLSHATPNKLTQAQACSSIENALKRLACYDELFVTQREVAVAEQLQAAEHVEPSKQVKPSEKVKLAKSVKALLVPNQNIDKFGREHIKTAEDEQTPAQLLATVVSLSKDPRKNRIFTLDNGQIWKESEQSKLRVKVGHKVYIEKGALSAYFLGREDKTRRIRVRRLN